MRIAAVPVALLALAGVNGVVAKNARSTQVADLATDWRQVATSADRARLRDWRKTWLAAVAAAQTADAAGVTREGVLLEPDRALAGAIPPAGAYRCRTVKLGRQGSAPRAFNVFSWSDCRIELDGNVTSFRRTGGLQRAAGRIYGDGTTRGVFLGALMLGDENRPLGYGRDSGRDMVGLVVRIGPKRWRIAFPQPRFESQLDVMELVPAG